MPRMNLFRKMIVALGMLVVPIGLLFIYSIHITTGIVKDQIKETNMNRLHYFVNQIDTQVQLMTISGSALTQDPSVQEFMGYSFIDDVYEKARTKAAIEQKLRLFALSNNWPLQVSIYSQYAQAVISNDPTKAFDSGILKQHGSFKWKAVPRPLSGSRTETGTEFYFYTFLPESKTDDLPANLALEMKFNEQPLVDMLDKFKQPNIDEPLLLQTEGGQIVNRTANPELIRQLTAIMAAHPSFLQVDAGAFNTELLEQSYEISFVKIPSLQWYALNAAPVEKIVKPIYKSRNLFLIFIGILTIFGFISAFMLFKQVQSPVMELIRSLKKIQTGNYSVRLHTSKKDEFFFLYHHFNAMAEQIQDLIEKVFSEKLQSREARLKHLQSQINPHFIYNCMGFIINMSKLNHQSAVVQMAQNLSSYYRYTTHLENPEADLKEELSLIRNYLDIQKLRTEHVFYEILVPDELLSLRMPRLLLQPVVENAIIHGIYGKIESGYVRIEASRQGAGMQIVIEDDGKGLSPEGMRELEKKLLMPLQGDTSCGLWNVNQRLKLRYGESAGVELEASPWGGLKVRLFWPLTTEELPS